ncbi:MAG: AMP-binding protein [Fimbriiglobus sp.]|nr:AMP-binding protein [Fimbriiglobus sp.]
MTEHFNRTQSLHYLRDRIAPNLTPFYSTKFAAAGTDLAAIYTWDDYRRLPFTTKDELVADQNTHPPYGSNHCAPTARYIRLHQTSGTSSGRPLRWRDTCDDWDRLCRLWDVGLRDDVGLTENDCTFFPFSFGPFLGFWAAFEALAKLGWAVLPGGGMSTTARLKYMLEHRATAVCCTPTYALHLAEVAATEGLNLAASNVRLLVLAGEPGGSIPATRQRVEIAWGAKVFDHYGLSEVGPLAFETRDTPGLLRVLHRDFITEVLEPGGDREVTDGEVGEVVVSNLYRVHAPVIRYRTGDLVRPSFRHGELFFDGGVIGRADDMIHVRGNNLYPSAIEAVVRRFPEVAEFRLVVDDTGPLPDLRVEVEPAPAADGPKLCEAIGRVVRDELLFRTDVIAVPPGSLPRFQMKARRLVRERKP